MRARDRLSTSNVQRPIGRRRRGAKSRMLNVTTIRYSSAAKVEHLGIVDALEVTALEYSVPGSLDES